MFLMTLATRTQTSATISASRNISPKELGAGLNGKTTATPSVQVLMTLSKLYINHQLLIWSSGDLRSSRQKFNFFQVRSIYQYTLDATSHARIWNTALLVKIKSFHSKTSLMVSCYGPLLMTWWWVNQWFEVLNNVFLSKGGNWAIDLPLAVSGGWVWRIPWPFPWVFLDDHLGFCHSTQEYQAIKDLFGLKFVPVGTLAK